ncbi:conserved Plasmodium protein, unknown function [Plasmodium gallinaceum]|uniref:Uncharacterized protein n=1 Tax=Plasmodium gallinaceum TaxID=5849 RepID=A0A1J1GN04_PLAGA|nr:conserved Plasmodium protein, unknown function [Plasmodium gallinaceum]CRG93831.1 conserved Plasmodium protein, unknown function [Plasmodium gallinaceum]
MKLGFQINSIFKKKKNGLNIFTLPYNNISILKNDTNKKFFHREKAEFSLSEIDDDINRNKIKKKQQQKDCFFFFNDQLFYKNIISKLSNKQIYPKHISHDFFHHLNKFHLNFLNNYFNEFFFKFTKTSKIFFGVLSSFCVLLCFFLITSSNYLEYNIILKYHIKFNSLLFSFFSSYYLALQVGSYYFKNISQYFNSFIFLLSSILSIFIADYDIWTSYYFLSVNYLFFLVVNYYNLYLKKFPNYIFKNVNRIIYFSLLSNYLAINKGKYIEKNIELLKNENSDISFYKLLKIKPYFL